MSIVQVYKKFPTNQDCLKHLEKIRWENKPVCPHCNRGDKFKRRNEEDGRRRRWWCGHCRTSSSVTVNTIMHHTRLPLQKWFLAITVLVNAKKSVSSHQLGRDIDVPVKTAYRISQKIRKAMMGSEMPLLSGIVEMDETYIGGKPRYKGTSKRGRGTSKMPVIGAVERGGNVRAEPVLGPLDRHILRSFALRHFKCKDTDLISDEYKGYSGIDSFVNTHETINHALEYVNGNLHTNNIESFWALVKRAHHGQYHWYSDKYAHLYLGESCFKYNHRKLINRKSSEAVVDKVLGGLVCTAL